MSDAQPRFSLHLDSERPDPFDAAAPRRAPVLLLHGFLATRRSMRPLSRRLRRDGYRVFCLDLGGRLPRRGIDELAGRVRDEVERLYAADPGMGRLVVVGHSLGGLVASWWVQRLGGHRRVRAVVTLGTPFHGTRVAWAGVLVGWLVRPVWQMLPGSAFLRRLREAAWPASVALVSLYSLRDRLAPWRAPPNARARGVEVDARHSDYLLQKRIYRKIVRELRRIPCREVAPAPAALAA